MESSVKMCNLNKFGFSDIPHLIKAVLRLSDNDITIIVYKVQDLLNNLNKKNFFSFFMRLKLSNI